MAGFRLIPMTEESAERPHGILKKSASMKPSKALHASLAIRWREISLQCRRDSDMTFRDAMLHAMSQAQDISIIKTLGIATHDVLVQQRATQRNFSRGRHWVTHLTRVLYRHDAHTQFADHSSTRKHHQNKQNNKH